MSLKPLNEMRRTQTLAMLFACLIISQVTAEKAEKAEKAESAEARVTRWLTNRLSVAAWQGLVDQWAASKAAMTAPIENLTLPVDHYKDGRKKIVLVARCAQILSKGLIFAEGVRLEMLTPEGKSDGVVVAEDCLLDQSTKFGYCRGLVDVKQGTDHIKGRGMMFSADDKFIKILADCEIRTRRIPSGVGRLP